MKLIFAQGNPGPDYTGTRHNVGFLCIDRFAADMDVTFVQKTKFHASVAETSVNGEKLILAKPTTFYNETGRAARALVDFYKLNPTDDLLILHDDLALPLGTVRTRKEGSDGGNNGIKSLTEHLGTQQYHRMRIGIFTDAHHQAATDFVLGRFTQYEKDCLNEVYKIDKRTDACICCRQATTYQPPTATPS